MIKRKEGSITVFLSLILVIILALVGTLLESARISAAKANSQRALLNAMEAVMTNYNRQLFEDYHLTFLEENMEGQNLSAEDILLNIEDYMGCVFEPNQSIELLGYEYDIKNLDLLKTSVYNLEYQKQVYATDYDGKIFINQTIQYMKYKAATDLIEKILEQLKLIKTASPTIQIVNNKLLLEQKVAQIDGYVLTAWSKIEGFKLKKSKISYTKKGTIKTADYFVKQYCLKDATNDNVSIYHDLVWSSLKGNYKNPLQVIESMENERTISYNAILEIAAIENNIATISEQISTSSDKKQIRKLKKEKKALEEELEEQQEIRDNSIRILIEQKNKFALEARQVLSCIDDALSLMPLIDQEQTGIAEDISSYETLLNSLKGFVDEAVFSDFTLELDKTKAYVGKESSDEQRNSFITNLLKMQPVLEKNKAILQRMIELEKITVEAKEDSLVSFQSTLTECKDVMKGYEIKSLRFDYNTFVFNPNVKNPTDKLQKLLRNGMLELLIDDVDKLSDAKIEDNSLYVKKAAQIENNKMEDKEELDNQELGDETERGLENIDMSTSGSLLEYFRANKEQKESDKGTSLPKAFNEYQESCDVGKLLEGTVNSIIETVLLNEYITDHFKNYANQSSKEILKQTNLTYEQEYLLFGNKVDKDNLADTIYLILFFRTIFNFIYILSDSNRKTMAETTAIALVGFTCLQPLVTLTKIIILFAWSLEEALIDTRAILDGKQAPILKTKDNFQLQFEELFLFNKQLIKTKADSVKEDKNPFNKMNYDNYIKVFLFLTGSKKKSYRSMDLIQTNMKIRYSTSFSMNNCIYGLRIKSDFYVPAVFLKLPFVEREVHFSKDGFYYTQEQEYAY